MFGFLDMMWDYEDRMVDRHEEDSLVVSTAFVTDGIKDYETAVKHPLYNDGEFVIVENYTTKEKAQIGHNVWVKKMTGEELPEKLVDCQNSHLSLMLDGDDLEFEKQ